MKIRETISIQRDPSLQPKLLYADKKHIGNTEQDVMAPFSNYYSHLPKLYL